MAEWRLGRGAARGEAELGRASSLRCPGPGSSERLCPGAACARGSAGGVSLLRGALRPRDAPSGFSQADHVKCPALPERLSPTRHDPAGAAVLVAPATCGPDRAPGRALRGSAARNTGPGSPSRESPVRTRRPAGVGGRPAAPLPPTRVQRAKAPALALRSGKCHLSETRDGCAVPPPPLGAGQGGAAERP